MQRNIKQISESGLTFCQLIFGGGKGVMLQDRKGGFWGGSTNCTSECTHILFVLVLAFWPLASPISNTIQSAS